MTRQTGFRGEFMGSDPEVSPEIAIAIERLSAPGYDCIEDSEAMRVLFDFGQLPIPPLTVYVGGLERETGSIAPLVVQIRHDQGRTLIHEHDPIESLTWGLCGWSGDPVPLDDESRQQLHNAIAALQSGIDRIKAFEAACDAAAAKPPSA